MVAALIYRSPQVGSGVVHLGDSCIDAGREHCCGGCRKAGFGRCDHAYCCMARLMGNRCGKTAHRAKYDLLRVGLVKLHGAGPKLCPCGKCGGGHAGGKILDASGRPVGAATGYELDPSLFAAPPKGSPPSRPSGYVSPAQQRVRSERKAKIDAALERMRPRAGP
jgi:hypothetical protein